MSSFLNQFLRQARVDAGLTQLELSRSLGFVSPQYVSNYERGLCRPGLKSFKALANALGIPVKKLIEAEMKEHRDKIRRIVGE